MKTHCVNGHPLVPENVYKNGTCKTCLRARNKAWASNNKEKKKEIDARRCKIKRKAASDAWTAKNKEKQLKAQKEWYARNKDKEKERHQKIYKENKDRILEVNREWRSKNSHKMLHYTRKYQLSKIQRTPKWLTEDHLVQIEAFYLYSKMLSDALGVQYHVDHIVPLQGENVSGLHVPWNLQVITASENMSKHNKLEVNSA